MRGARRVARDKSSGEISRMEEETREREGLIFSWGMHFRISGFPRDVIKEREREPMFGAQETTDSRGSFPSFTAKARMNVNSRRM